MGALCCKRGLPWRPASEEEIRLRALLQNSKHLKAITKQCCDGCRGKALSEREVPNFLQLLAARCHASSLPQGMAANMLFARFDTNSDGCLSLEESFGLVQAILSKRCNELSSGRDLKIPRKTFSDHYTITKKLGEGGQGAMYLARKNSTGDQRCVKKYEKGNPNAPLEDIKEEFKHMKSFNSPYVSRTYDIFQDYRYVYILSEPYRGQDLRSLVANTTKAGVVMNHMWWCGIFEQVLKGLVYIHQAFVIHCDLKEANVMIAGERDWNHPHIILIDFGLSVRFLSQESGICGTPGYIAPETYRKGYWVPKGDVFSAGVMFYSLISGGTTPFMTSRLRCRGNEDFFREIRRRTCAQEAVPVEHLPTSVRTKKLLGEMLAKDLRGRPTASACLQHSCFHGQAKRNSVPDSSTLWRLKQVHHRSTSQLVALEQLLSSCNLAEMGGLNDFFRRLDVDGDGSVSAQEARNVLRNIPGLSDSQINEIVRALTGQSGRVQYLQFMVHMLGKELVIEERRLVDLFRRVDVNGDGVISREELPALVQECRYDSELTDKLMAELDADGDGKITFPEFMQVCLGLTSSLGGAMGVKRSPNAYDDLKRRRLY